MLEPITQKSWSEIKAAHLLNRAGFGGTPAEVKSFYDLGPQKAVDQLTDYRQSHDDFPAPTWVVPGIEKRPFPRGMKMLEEPERRKKRQEYQREQRSHLLELRAWWLYRMRYTKRPLQEKMTLFWHGHFATGIRKVRSAYAMYVQNETLRALACGNYRDLVTAVAKDPAMLIYLDGAQNRRHAPNENFARELMELFTLGEGHYTEEDIKEAARAFTGWSVGRQEFEFENNSRAHDRGNKKFMGHRGGFDGDDIIRIILSERRAKEFIAGKLWSFFAYDDPEPGLVTALGDALDESGLELRLFMNKLFLSREFYSAKAVRTQVKSPAQWLIGTLRCLDARMPDPRLTQYMMKMLGQELFEPPNVKGWDGGYTWITTATLFHRYNFAGALVKGGWAAGGWKDPVVETDKLLPAGILGDAVEALKSLQWRLFQHGLREKDREALRKVVEARPVGGKWSDDDVSDAILLMMSTPQYQLT
ncbi:MAG: DUF1800 domain-containing protein [Verrucomicrobia bacterium]|nr:DUF1800 domain-containing protein [Verrucomicrobiota bacterium]